jgi:hypothetical protein
MNRITASSLALVLVALSTVSASAEEQAKVTTTGPAVAEQATVAMKPQTLCPIMGGAINKSVYVEKNGLRIYACCKGCIPAIEKDFKKIAAKLESQGIAVQKVQTMCPVLTKEKISKRTYVDYEGKRIYVCCGDCQAKVKKDPAKYIEQLEKQGITLDTTPVKK